MFSTSSNPMSSTLEEGGIKYKFIVVYNRFTEPIAQSLYNRAIEKGISCTTWNEKEYVQSKAGLTNSNYLELLSENIIKKNLADPTLKQNEIILGVLYKKQGHQIGVYVKESPDLVKIALLIGASLGERWSTVVMNLISPLNFWLMMNQNKRAKFYLLMKAIDVFDNNMMEKYVQDKL